jgi:hypothetical protein
VNIAFIVGSGCVDDRALKDRVLKSRSKRPMSIARFASVGSISDGP